MGNSLKKIKRYFSFAVVSMAVMFSCGCTNALNFRQAYDEATAAYNEKKYDVAVVQFNKALNYKPDSYSSLCLLGASYAYLKDEKMAEKTFQDAIKLFPDEWNAYVYLADLKRSQHDYAMAREYYETAVTLESMGGKEKLYYKKFLKTLKTEEEAYEMKNSVESPLMKFKQNPSDSTGTTVTPDGVNGPVNAIVVNGVALNINPKNWEKALEQKDEKSSMVEYQLKGEDFKTNRWSKLVTVQYFLITETFKPSLDSYYEGHIQAIETVAKNSGKTFEKKVIYKKQNDMMYEWKFDGGKESEISRIIMAKDALYHVHFAKRGVFAPEEKAKFWDILKTAKVE